MYLLYASILRDSTKNDSWLNTNLSLSGWAIGYPFAYILYRVLDDFKPKKILELGLGQSTKITCDYVNSHKNIIHDIVDHNQEWIDFFKENYDISKCQHMHLLENYKKEYNGTKLNAYKKFKTEFSKSKFDLIVIDGPVESGQEYSRMEVLDIVLSCLEKSFVILLE